MAEVEARRLEARSLEAPDEVRTPEKTVIEVVALGRNEVGRFTFQPGWKWSECIKPLVGTDSCQAEHLGYVVSGRMHVEQVDGASVELAPGQVYLLPPGHDAWVVGDEPFVGMEFKSADEYAKD